MPELRAHALTDEQAKWLLVLAIPKKSAIAMTIPRGVQSALVEKGLIRVVHGLPRATQEGKAELLQRMLVSPAP